MGKSADFDWSQFSLDNISIGQSISSVRKVYNEKSFVIENVQGGAYWRSKGSSAPSQIEFTNNTVVKVTGRTLRYKNASVLPKDFDANSVISTFGHPSVVTDSMESYWHYWNGNRGIIFVMVRDIHHQEDVLEIMLTSKNQVVRSALSRHFFNSKSDSVKVWRTKTGDYTPSSP